VDYANELKADAYWEVLDKLLSEKGSEEEVPEVVLAPEPAGGARPRPSPTSDCAFDHAV
jgi:hypothetical protein